MIIYIFINLFTKPCAQALISKADNIEIIKYDNDLGNYESMITQGQDLFRNNTLCLLTNAKQKKWFQRIEV